MQQKKLADFIAQAIHKADTRYFFEDYTKQAEAVLKALKQAGLVVVPLDPSPEAIQAGKDALKYGAQHRGDMLKTLYQAMINATK